MKKLLKGASIIRFSKPKGCMFVKIYLGLLRVHGQMNLPYNLFLKLKCAPLFFVRQKLINVLGIKVFFCKNPPKSINKMAKRLTIL